MVKFSDRAKIRAKYWERTRYRSQARVTGAERQGPNRSNPRLMHWTLASLGVRYRCLILRGCGSCGLQFWISQGNNTV